MWSYFQVSEWSYFQVSVALFPGQCVELFTDMDLFSGQCVELFTGQMWTCFRVNVWSYLQVRCGPVFGSMCGAINRSGVELFSGQCMELFSSVPHCARERVCVRARAFNGLS